MARTRFSVATCNLFNLNRPGLPMYRDPDGWDQAAYDRKIEWTAAQIRRIDADVWGFQELWHQDALADLIAAARLDEEYRLLTPPVQQGGRIICAAAVRADLLQGDPEWIEAFPERFVLEGGGDDPQTGDIAVKIDRFSRPVLRFRIRPRKNGSDIVCLVAHLKSKRPTDIYNEGWYRRDSDYYGKHRDAIGGALATVRRTAEALALRMILTDTLKGTDVPLIVLGDLNDGSESNTLALITGQPNYIVSALHRGGSDTDLYSVGDIQNLHSMRDVYYTHVYQQSLESLDHILVSQELYDLSKKRVWALRGMQLFNDHLNRDDHKEAGTTDHGIVWADFEYWPEADEE